MESIKAAEEELETAKKEAEDDCLLLLPLCLDGRNPANQLRLVVYPIIHSVLYILGGAGVLNESTVSPYLLLVA